MPFHFSPDTVKAIFFSYLHIINFGSECQHQREFIYSFWYSKHEGICNAYHVEFIFNYERNDFACCGFN